MPTRRCAGRGGLAQPAPRSSAILAQCESHGPTRTPSSRTRTAEFGDIIETTGPQDCSHGSSSPAPGRVPPGPWPCPLSGQPSLGSSRYLTRHPVGAELPKAQGWLDPSQQSDHVQVFDPAPAGGQQAGGPGSPTWSGLLLRGRAQGRARRRGRLPHCPPAFGKRKPGAGSLFRGQFALPTASTGLSFGARIPSDTGSPGLESGPPLPGFDAAGWGLSAELVEGWRGVEAIRTKRGNTWWLHRARLLGASECELAPRAVSGRQRCTQGPCARLTGGTDPVGPGLRAPRLCQAPGCWRWTTL